MTKFEHKNDRLEEHKKTRITWARGLTNYEIGGLLQMKLLESRASGGTEVNLINELVHEIKKRLVIRKVA